MYERLLNFSKLLFNAFLPYLSLFILYLGGGRYLLVAKIFQYARTGVQREECGIYCFWSLCTGLAFQCVSGCAK